MITLETGGTLAGKAGTASAITYTLQGDAVGVADAFKTLAQGQLSASATTLYTVPASTQTLVKQIHLANTTGSDVTGIVFYVNGTVGTNQITGTMKIVANGTAVYAGGSWSFYDATGAQVIAGAVPSTRLINTTAPLTGGGDLTADRTLAISASTTSVAGSMSALDKSKLDNIWIDVSANTTALVLPGNTASVNITNLNAILSAAPNGSTIYFPPGQYQFNAAWTMPNKMFTFCGRGSNRAGSPATAFTELRWIANVGGTLITLPGSGNGWYTQFRDLTFTAATADQASGAVISANGNVGVNVINCSFQSAGSFFFDVLSYDGGNGSNSANSTVVENCVIQGYKGTAIRCNASGSSLVVSCSVIQGQWGGTGGTPAAAMAAAGISGGFVGALQINDCDVLGNVNNLLLNPVLANSEVAASVFCTNTYFDNSGGSCIKISGTGATVRARFDTCSFTTAGTNFTTTGTNLTAVEIASTFAYGAGGQGLDFVNCNVLNTFGTTGTTNGFLVSGTADFSIGNSRIAKWTNGIQVTPIGTAGVTQPTISNNTIGPAGGYAGNTTGILLNGATAYGPIIIEGNHLAGNTTTPFSDSSTVGATTTKYINGNSGLPAGSVAAATFNSTALTTVETVVGGLVLPVPKNSLKVGTVFRVTLSYKPAISTVTTVRIRLGSSASVPATDAAVIAVSNVASAATCLAVLVTQATVIGASAAHVGNGTISNGTNLISTSANAAATGTFDSTADGFVMVTLTNTTSTTTTIASGILEIVSP